MNKFDLSVTYGRNRWIVVESYFGCFDHTQTVCSCFDSMTAVSVVDAFVVSHIGRPYCYSIAKVALDDDPVRDQLIFKNILTDEVSDYTSYLKGISCLK